MSASVTVRGRSVLPVQPDEAQVVLTISSVRQNAEEALEEVASRSRSLTQLLDEMEVPPSLRTSSGVSVSEERSWKRDELITRGHRASSSVVVRIQEINRVGRLIMEATRRVDASISGPHWRIELGNPVRLDACRLAAEEARRKAEAYAQALGMRLGAVMQIVEPGLRRNPDEGGMILSAASAGSASTDLDIESGDLDVTAAIEITFTLEH